VSYRPFDSAQLEVNEGSPMTHVITTWPGIASPKPGPLSYLCAKVISSPAEGAGRRCAGPCSAS